MRLRHAIDMLADGDLGALGPTTWADLGCGEGTFTRALASVLAAGSVIHAVDLDERALGALPPEHDGVRIVTHVADFMSSPWPFAARLDGILMANSLHYVRDQARFIRDCASRLTPQHRFVVVEYDTDRPNRWVPYPLSWKALSTLFGEADYASASIGRLGSRPSVYQRAPLYAALITSVDRS